MDLFSLAIGIALGVIFDESFTKAWKWLRNWWANRNADS